MAITADLVASLDAQLTADLATNGRLGKPARYLAGEHDKPYMPKGAKKEFEHLANRAITNWTPLLSDTFVKALFVDGYRPTKSTDNANAWAYWQDNGLDARQVVAHRGALEYGTSYVLVLPGQDKARPIIKPLSPLRSMAWYTDIDDEFPVYALRRLSDRPDKSRVVEVYDAEAIYTFVLKDGGDKWAPEGGGRKHGLGVTPFVRFRDRLDGEAVGVVRPAITLQDRVNEVVFATLIAMQYASFRQRWATGLVVPTVDDEDDPNYGKPIEPFEAAINRLWVSDSTDTKFGDFAQTEISGHLSLYDATVKTLAAVSQISPNVLTGDLVNLSAEALAQLQDTTQRKLAEYEILFGEAWEQVLRLAAAAAGDATGASDTSSEVKWRDTEARALAATVDALGKIVTMLNVPAEAVWDRIPGVTETDVQRWLAMRQTDPLESLTAELAKQATSEASATPAAAATEGEDATTVKAKADALGSLIRSGVDPASAAAKVGLVGVEFTGAMPVSLRLPEADAAALEVK